MILVICLLLIVLAFVAGFIAAHFHMPSYIASLNEAELVALTLKVEKVRSE